MIGSDRDQLDLLLLLRELPDDATVVVNVYGLRRDDFDRLPGEDTDGRGLVVGSWAKRAVLGPVKVEFYTSEPPPTVIGFPLAAGERAPLRRVK